MCVCVYVCVHIIHTYTYIHTFSGRLALGVLDHSRVVPFIIYYLPYTIVPPPPGRSWGQNLVSNS